MREEVDRVASSGLSAGAVARELGLHETVLRRWMSQFSPVQATGTPRRPMERDILKKAALIFGAASR